MTARLIASRALCVLIVACNEHVYPELRPHDAAIAGTGGIGGLGGVGGVGGVGGHAGFAGMGGVGAMGGAGGFGGSPFDCDVFSWDHDADLRTPCVPRTDCPPGTWVIYDGDRLMDRQCVACPPPLFTDAWNSTECLVPAPCTAGSYMWRQGTSSSAPGCMTCSSGEYCPGGIESPTPCPFGSWDNDANAASPCVAWRECAQGEYPIMIGSATTDRSCARAASVFLTSEVYGADLGSVWDADLKCQELAVAANLPGVFWAWLSANGISAADRFMRRGGPYALLDGTLIANDWLDLTDGTLLHSIDVTNQRMRVDCNGASTCEQVFTGTASDGSWMMSVATECADWTSTYGNFWAGDYLATGPGWTASSMLRCDQVGRLYCFEQ